MKVPVAQTKECSMVHMKVGVYTLKTVGQINLVCTSTMQCLLYIKHKLNFINLLKTYLHV